MLLKLIFLILGSVFTLMFIVNLIRGKKYAYLVETISGADYPLKDLYVAGFSLNDSKLFKLRGNLEKSLKTNAKLLWDNVYYEYYAMLSWAQFLTFANLILALGFSVSAFFEMEAAIILMIVFVIVIAAVWNISISKMKEMVSARREECILEFPNMVSKLSLLINTGMILREAWYTVAKGKDGELYTLMRKACECMENGDSEVVAIYKFGVLSDSPEIKKFTSALVQGIEKGNSELAEFLLSQTSELWAKKRQLALQKGEIAAGKLIVPLGIMFAGIIMIIVSAAMQSFSF